MADTQARAEAPAHRDPSGRDDDSGFDPRSPLRRSWIGVALSFVLGVGLLALVAERMTLVPADPWLPPGTIALYGACLLAYLVLRSVRWHFLISPLGAVSPIDSTLAALAGFFWVMLLPFRLGELARPVLLRPHTSIKTAALLASVALERVVDGLIVCALFFVALASTPTLARLEGEASVALGASTWMAGIASVVLAAALLVFLAMARWPDGVGLLVSRPLAIVWPAAGEKAEALAAELARGLAALPSVRHLAAFVAVSLLYWGVNGLGMWVLARGCGLSVSLLEMFAIMSILNIALLVPGGPAQLGNFQLGIVWGLSVFVGDGASTAGAANFAFWLYTSQTVAIGAAGLGAQWQLGRRTPAIPRGASPDRPDAVAVERRAGIQGEDPPARSDATGGEA